jgi:hypothetical protein
MLKPSGLKAPTKILKPGSTALKTPAAGKRLLFIFILFHFILRQGFSTFQGCPEIHSVHQASLKLRGLPASTS